MKKTDEITRLLGELAAGKSDAEVPLQKALFNELRAMARERMRDERLGHTLQPTALINEAYLKLSPRIGRMENRRHFFAAACDAMGQVLVDYARARGAAKRTPVEPPESPSFASGVEEYLELSDVIERLESEYPRPCRILKARLFGFSSEEIAERLEMAKRSAQREWKIARTLAFRRYYGYDE